MKTAADVARAVADACERRELPYAIGGALALGFYTAPRATVDVDINVFVEPERELTAALGVLAEAGFEPERPASLDEQARRDGQFRGFVDGLRVDVFVPAIPYYAELSGRRRRVVLFDRPLWVLGPEDLAVLKLMFFRRKDLADVEALLRDQHGLDRTFVRAKLVELAGEDDPRIAAWDEVAREVGPSAPHA